MKRILLFLFFLSLSFSGFSQEKKEAQKPKKVPCKEKVYICNSTASKTYHFSKECGGLKLCKDTIVSICKMKAEKKFGRLLCSYEKGKN